MAAAKDRNAQSRKDFYAKIRYNDWDMVVIPQSVLEKIPDHPDRERQFIEESIDEKLEVIEAMQSDRENARLVGGLKKEVEKMRERLAAIDSETPTEEPDITSKKKDGTEVDELTDKNGNLINGSEAVGKYLLVEAMSEQGRVNIGYGDISNKNPQFSNLDVRGTLLDTYTGGFNLLTGINSDEVIARNNANPPTTPDVGTYIMDRLNKSPLALIGQASLAIENNLTSGDINKDKLHDILGKTIEDMTVTEHTVSTVYSDLGNKYKLLEDTDTRLKLLQDSLTEQYTDILGADPYASIMEMYNNQNSYNAALRVGSQLMSSSLFDFMR